MKNKETTLSAKKMFCSSRSGDNVAVAASSPDGQRVFQEVGENGDAGQESPEREGARQVLQFQRHVVRFRPAIASAVLTFGHVRLVPVVDEARFPDELDPAPHRRQAVNVIDVRNQKPKKKRLTYLAEMALE